MKNNTFHNSCFFGVLIGLMIGEVMANPNIMVLNLSVIFGLSISYFIKHIILKVRRGLIIDEFFLVESIIGLLIGLFKSTLLSIILGPIKTGLFFGFMTGLAIKIN